MNMVWGLIIRVVAIMIAAYVVPGVAIEGLGTAVVVAVVLGILNTLVKPVLLVLTLPITILTLGLFALVVNTLMVLLTDYVVRGFAVEGFGTALIFAIVLGVVNWFLNRFEK